MDGFGYQENGTPSTTPPNIPGSPIDRELRYNWLWVIQRPNNSIPSTANMTVVVFERRAFQFAPANAEAVFNPLINGAAVGLTTVSFPPGTDLGVQKGGWILDASITPSGVRNANFYRVVSVEDNSGSVDVELQTPIKPDTKGPGVFDIPPANANLRTFIVVAGVSEVFERPTLTPYDF